VADRRQFERLIPAAVPGDEHRGDAPAAGDRFALTPTAADPSRFHSRRLPPDPHSRGYAATDGLDSESDV